MNSDRSRETEVSTTTKRVTAGFLLATGVCCAFLLGPITYRTDRTLVYEWTMAFLAGFVSPAIFSVAAARVFFDLRSACRIGLLASAFPWRHFLRSEFHDYGFSNSWVAFNTPDFYMSYYPNPGLNVLTIVLLMLSTGCCALRLLPVRWSVWGKPLRERTSLVIIGTSIIVAVWFVSAVRPYRIPVLTRGGGYPDFSLIHVQKHGLRFQETEIYVHHSGQAFVLENHRRLFQYRFEKTVSERLLSRGKYRQLQDIVRSPAFTVPGGSDTVTPPNGWHYEWWFIRNCFKHCETAATADSSNMPAQLLSWVKDVESLPGKDWERQTAKDVCLGFCYNPAYVRR